MACTVCKALGYRGEDHNKRTCKHAARVYNAEHGGGRPPNQHIYDELFAQLEDPPTNPLELARWAQRIIGQCVKATAQGKGSSKRNTEIVRLVRAIVSLTPKDIMYEAQERLKAEYETVSKKAKDAQALSRPVGNSKPLR